MESQESFAGTIQHLIDEKFPGQLIEVVEQLGETTLVVRRERIVDILRFLRDDPQTHFDFLVDVCGVDYLEMGWHERFAVVYHLCSLRDRRRLRVRVPVPEGDPSIDSIVELWPAANWAEREVFDLFGIRFKGHPDLRRILNPDDFEGHPLRKDFPLQGIGYREKFERIERGQAQ